MNQQKSHAQRVLVASYRRVYSRMRWLNALAERGLRPAVRAVAKLRTAAQRMAGSTPSRRPGLSVGVLGFGGMELLTAVENGGPCRDRDGVSCRHGGHRGAQTGGGLGAGSGQACNSARQKPATRSSVLAGVRRRSLAGYARRLANGTLRDGLLDRGLFLSLPEARAVFDQRRVNCNYSERIVA